jgi:hypothetical protein
VVVSSALHPGPWLRLVGTTLLGVRTLDPLGYGLLQHMAGNFEPCARAPLLLGVMVLRKGRCEVRKVLLVLGAFSRGDSESIM